MSLNETGAFIVPHYNDGNEIELKWFGEALNSIKLQTDNDWKIIVIDDASTSEKAISFLKQMKKDFSEKMEVIFLQKIWAPAMLVISVLRELLNWAAHLFYSLIKMIFPILKDLRLQEKYLTVNRKPELFTVHFR